MSEVDDASKELGLLFQAMGMALARWQGVEDLHYLLFVKMLGAPKEEICSILYFSPPSFESRRVMVDRVASVFLSKEHAKEWTKLSERLGKCASKRGRVAHYSLDFAVSGQHLTEAKVGSPRIQPSRYNKVASIQGKGDGNPEHQLSASRIFEFVLEFEQVKRDLTEFIKKIPFAVPLQGANLLSAVSPDPPSPAELSLLLLNAQPLGEPSSDR